MKVNNYSDIAGHSNAQEYYKRVPLEVAQELIQSLSSFDFLYFKNLRVNLNPLITPIRQAVSEASPNTAIPVSSTLERNLVTNNPSKNCKIDTLAFYRNWPDTAGQYDFCAVFSEPDLELKRAPLVFRPLRKNVDLSFYHLSEECLEEVAYLTGIKPYNPGYSRSPKWLRAFNRLFPPLDESSSPRQYKQSFIDAQEVSWLRRRNKCLVHSETHDERRSKAMKLIESAFAAYDLERIVLPIVKFKLWPRNMWF